jgi:hypothetical protein
MFSGSDHRALENDDIGVSLASVKRALDSATEGREDIYGTDSLGVTARSSTSRVKRSFNIVNSFEKLEPAY